MRLRYARRLPKARPGSRIRRTRNCCSRTNRLCARSKRSCVCYLQDSKADRPNVPTHNNAGLVDVEAPYLIEGDVDALAHIHITAMSFLGVPVWARELAESEVAGAIACDCTTIIERGTD
jgi:hypothetical protein